MRDTLKMNLTVGSHHVVQAYHVIMTEGLEEFDLSHRSHRETIALRFHAYPLQGNMKTSGCIPSLVDLAKRPFSDLTDDGVQLIPGSLRRMRPRAFRAISFTCMRRRRRRRSARFFHVPDISSTSELLRVRWRYQMGGWRRHRGRETAQVRRIGS